MADNLTTYKIFIASPGGLQDVRTAFRDEIDEYNTSDAKHRGVEFEAVGWEDTLPGIGRPQHIINKDIRTCHYFVMVLHDRWGSPPARKNRGKKPKFTSGTEEEFDVAGKCLRSRRAPMRQIIPLFRGVDAGKLSDPGPQLKKVLTFRKRLEREKKFLYGTFDEAEEFKTTLRRLLAKWVRDHEAKTMPAITGGPILPTSPGPDVQRPEPTQDESSSDETDKAIAEADRLADAGKLVEAETAYAREAVKGTPFAINAYGHFLRRVGRLSQAQAMYERVAEIGKARHPGWLAIAYGNIGLIFRERGAMKDAERMHRESLEINKGIGDLRGVARQYGNLGNIWRTRGDLAKAEKMHRKALKIDEGIDCLEGMANQYGNLAGICAMRGDLPEAERMYRKVLAFEKRLKRPTGIADANNGLALIICKTGGNLDDAERMLREALKINTRLGRPEGIANTYGNLGAIFEARGHLPEAERMLRKGLDADKRLGRLDGMAAHYDNLGTIRQARGYPADAEKMFKEALKINEHLGHLENMIIQYTKLGQIYGERGDLGDAEGMFNKALATSKDLGRLDGMASAHANLGNIYQMRGDSKEAKRLWTKAVVLYKQAKIPEWAARIQDCIDSLDNN